jgi:phosphatidylglycerophosphatase A
LFLGFILSVWLCGAAEKILGQTDPGSIVLDEITALPVCFLGWLAVDYARKGRLMAPESFFDGPTLCRTLLICALFRFFDILKPWPVRQSQKLPGGWGVTVDDFLAAIYVSPIALLLAL